MTECPCNVCCRRRREGLPPFAGVSAFRDVHVTAEELGCGSRPELPAIVRVVERPAPYPPAGWVRGLEEALAKIVGHVEQRLDRLELELSLERRLAALEARTTDLDAESKFERGQLLDLPSYSSWRGSR